MNGGNDSTRQLRTSNRTKESNAPLCSLNVHLLRCYDQIRTKNWKERKYIMYHILTYSLGRGNHVIYRITTFSSGRWKYHMYLVSCSRYVLSIRIAADGCREDAIPKHRPLHASDFFQGLAFFFGRAVVFVSLNRIVSASSYRCDRFNLYLEAVGS